MPTDTLDAPASAAPAAMDVSRLQAGAAAEARDTGRPRREMRNPDRSDARAKLAQIGKDMAAGKITDAKDAQPAEAKTSTSETSPPPATAKPVAKDAPPPTKETPKEQPKPQTAEEKAQAADKSKRVAQAKRALAYDGWEPEDIEALSEDKLLKIGNHRAKNQADINREFSKLRSSNSPTGARNDDGTFAQATPPKAEDAPAPKADAPKEQAKAPAPQQADPSDLDALIESAQDEIGEPATKLLKTMAKMIESKVRGQHEVGQAAVMEMMYAKAFDAIETAHPGKLAEAPESFDEFSETLKAYIGSGRFGRGQLSKAIDAAIYTTYGAPDSITKAQRDMLARQTAADIGKVDAGRSDRDSTAAPEPVEGKAALQLAAAMFNKAAPATPAELEALRKDLMTKVKAAR